MIPIPEFDKTGRCEFWLAEHLPIEGLGVTRFSHPEARERVVSFFLHSANYKFSLGSGASFVVKSIIDEEKRQYNKSRLERSMQRIRKTPVCGVRVTPGGDFSGPFQPNPEKDVWYPNFDHIIHAIIPGPRIDDFHARVETMVSQCLSEISSLLAQYQSPLIDFYLPIIGVNNFGYPLPFMTALYCRLLANWIQENHLQGRVVLSVQKGHIMAVSEYFMP